MRILRLGQALAITLGLGPGVALAQQQLAQQPSLPPPPSLPAPPLLPAPPPEFQQPEQSPPFPFGGPAGSAPGGLTVYMRTTDLNATLSRLSGQQTRRVWGRHGSYLRTYNTWSPVCRAPCALPVNPEDVYQIRGLNINPSASFMLPTSGAVSLDVKAGHAGTQVGGVLLTTFGSLPLIVGLVFTPLGAALFRTSEGPGFLIAGGITLGIGSALLGGGIHLLVASRTRVWTSDGYRLAARNPPRLAFSSAGLHF